jgi:hypothetical protein
MYIEGVKQHKTFNKNFAINVKEKKMAKKIVAICTAMALCGAALFAQEEQEDTVKTQTKGKMNFEIGIGYHNDAETQTVSGVEAKRTVPSFAINFAWKDFPTERAGIAIYGNILFPHELTISAQGQSVTVDKSAYDFLLGLDGLIGPAFILYKNKNFCLPLAVGIHYHRLWGLVDSTSIVTNKIGLGANLSGEYHFHKNVYLYGRIQLSMDFYSWGTEEAAVYTPERGYSSESKSASGSLFAFSIEPCLGIGFQW